MENEIVNRVAESGLITINLEDFYPSGDRVLFDIKSLLFEELILKEKDFRDYVNMHDWSQYREKYVAVTCTADAIVPTWAYMLLASALQPFAKRVVFGDLAALEMMLFNEVIAQKLSPEMYRDKRVVIKGCGDKEIPASAFVEVTRILRPVAKSIMYGEPCSTVPVFKKKE